MLQEDIKEYKYVIDTVGLIAYYNGIFFESEKFLSKKVKSIIDKCLSKDYLGYKLIIPSVVFIEIFEKQLKSEESVAKFKSSVFKPLQDNEFVEIRSLDLEVLQIYFSFNDQIAKLETHDKIIYSTSIMLDSTLISCDEKIIHYNSKTELIEIIF
ncbi:MAG TPA: hypothetical protein VKZ80_05035 [Flavobacterium sp.]|jgi:hypothetical protein|nr:hypothetical protein [Flavobacterium sp.]